MHSAHNKQRAQHGSPPLAWSSLAAARAKGWAETLAESGTLEHGNYKGFGQNLAYKMGAETAEMWYQEVEQYDFNRPGYQNGTGHFTQLVWAATTHMGAAKVVCGNRSYVVANYSPAGNVANETQFEQNVKRRLP